MKIVDAHCDTLNAMLEKKEGFGENSLQINLKNIKAGGLGNLLQFFAVFVHPSLSLEDGMKATEDMIDIFNHMSREGFIEVIRNSSDLDKEGLKGLLSMEGMYFTGGNRDIVDELHSKGVRCMSLTWNPDNMYSGGISGNTAGGLTREGSRVVERALEKGILIDVSHISDAGFFDVAEIASEYGKPFAATHSNARALCHHKRNLDDSMLSTIAAADGFTGINMYSCFLSDNCEADVEDVVAHIDYICSRTGPAHVGFGSDFDGIDRNKSAIAGPHEFHDVIDRLLSMNYNEDDVRNIAFGNIERVLRKTLV
ncbi:MAG TPA: membrane dipeptidase [Clostridia bacterium]|nr:membrane dipeptidase [Clostridia bacterium]